VKSMQCFDLIDLLAESGLSDVQSGGGASEVQLFCQDDDCVEVTNFNPGEHCPGSFPNRQRLVNTLHLAKEPGAGKSIKKELFLPTAGMAAGQGECLTLTSRHDTICTCGHLILSRVEALSDVQQRVEPGMGSFEFYPPYRGSPARDNRIDSCRAELVATRPGSRV